MKKKQIFIIIGCLLVVAFGIVIFLCLTNKRNSNDEVTRVNNLLEKSSVIDGGVSKDKRVEIKLNNENMESVIKVDVWLFSNPVYLGEFNLIKSENGYYELDDISSVLKDKNIEAGNHKLLILKDKEALGYVDIKVDINSILETTLDDLGSNNETESDDRATFEETGSDEALTDKENNSSDIKNNTTNDKQNSNTNNTNKDNSSTSKKEDTSTTVKKEEPAEEPKQEEVKCTPKKFKNKYTYVFEDKETCVKNGDQMDAWEYFHANGIPATSYGCEEIVDECGKTYYGVYYGNTENQKFYY